MVWEHEIYNDMEYIASTEFLHTFEGEVKYIYFFIVRKKQIIIIFNRSIWLGLILQVWRKQEI